MARYEHLPIYRAAFDLAVHIEQIVRNFSRYHKYTLGTELRDGSHRILQRIIEANGASESRDRTTVLEALRWEIESFKVTARLARESEAFASTRAYLHGRLTDSAERALVCRWEGAARGLPAGGCP